MFLKHLAWGLGEDITPPTVVMLNFLLKQVSTSKAASQLKKNAKEIVAWEMAHGTPVAGLPRTGVGCRGLGGGHMVLSVSL